MRTKKSNQSITAKSGISVAISSGNELPIMQQGEALLIDARLLHQQLKCETRFNDWISRKIQDFGFENGKDYYSNLSNQKFKGKGGDRRSIEYHLTLDMAKELAMLERNETGREIRRYFIRKEKEARGVSYLPAEKLLFKGIKPRRINDRLMFAYQEVLERCGYSTHSSGHRRVKYWMHFVKEGTKLYVTEEFALHLYHQRQVTNNRVALKAMQPVLPLNFGDVALLNEKGGYHD